MGWKPNNRGGKIVSFDWLNKLPVRYRQSSSHPITINDLINLQCPDKYLLTPLLTWILLASVWLPIPFEFDYFVRDPSLKCNNGIPAVENKSRDVNFRHERSDYLSKRHRLITRPIHPRWSKNMSTYLFYRSFYKHWPISIKFDTQYTEKTCNATIIYVSTSPALCRYTTLGKINLWFWDHSGQFALSIQLLNQLRR